MEPSLLWQGLELMLVGMGTVFVFLTLLVLATRLMSWATGRWRPAAAAPATAPISGPRPTEAEVAAMAAALEAHRRRR